MMRGVNIEYKFIIMHKFAIGYRYKDNNIISKSWIYDFYKIS